MMFRSFGRAHHMMRLGWMTSLLLSIPLLGQQDGAALAADDVSIEATADHIAAQKEIAAVLRDRCVHCHGESDEVMGGG